MGLDIVGAIKRAITLPSRYNSLSDILSDPLGAITSAAQTYATVATVGGLPSPAWIDTLAEVGAVYSQFQAAREAESLSNAMLAGQRDTVRKVQEVIAALNAVPPPQAVAPRLEAQMRANLQVALEQARRYAPPGVDVSGVLNLMNARGLAQIANVYNQAYLQDVENQRQDLLRRLQLQAGLMGDVYQMQQGIYGLAMQRQQILQQGIANALLTFSQMLSKPAPATPPQQIASDLMRAGAGAALSTAGAYGAAASLWNMGRRRK
jgi:hypothetical protein